MITAMYTTNVSAKTDRYFGNGGGTVMDMRVKIAGVEWNNPVTVASGTFGSGEEYSEFVDLNRLGAVTTKGVANVPWPGKSDTESCGDPQRNDECHWTAESGN